MTTKDKAANAAATFLEYQEQQDGTEALPCIEIGGVQVYAYVRDGILVVSIDTETADASDDTPFALFGSDQVPVTVNVGDVRVFEDFPENWVAEEDARLIRKGMASSGEMPMWVLPGWAATEWS